MAVAAEAVFTITFAVFVVPTMLAAGLGASLSGLRALKHDRRRWWLLALFIANLILVPLLGWAIVDAVSTSGRNEASSAKTLVRALRQPSLTRKRSYLRILRLPL